MFTPIFLLNICSFAVTFLLNYRYHRHCNIPSLSISMKSFLQKSIPYIQQYFNYLKKLEKDKYF